MSTYRQIHTRIWQDAWFLDLLPEEKLLFVYLFSNEHASLCGLYELPLKTMAFETGLRTDAITLALDRFGKAGKVLYESPYIWVPNLRKYNANGSPKVAAMLAEQVAEIPDCDLKRRYLAGDIGPLPVAPVEEAPQTDVSPIPYQANLANPTSNSNSNSNSNSSSSKNKKERGAASQRPPDALFNAISRVCHVDPATSGPSIGKVRAVLSKAGYTPEEVLKFGTLWRLPGPPTVWQLQEQIGVVRRQEEDRRSYVTGPLSEFIEH